jgi:hypothetical protein
MDLIKLFNDAFKKQEMHPHSMRSVWRRLHLDLPLLLGTLTLKYHDGRATNHPY